MPAAAPCRQLSRGIYPGVIFGKYRRDNISRSRIGRLKFAKQTQSADCASAAWMKAAKFLTPRLSDFEIRETLGTGSFGRVRLVQYKEDRKYYALKILKKSGVVQLKQVDHVKMEKKILEEISHPFIVNLYGAFQDPQNLYLMMEYVIGGEFFSHLRKAGRFPNDTACFYAAEVANVFGYLHRLQILYRDLKPENLLLDAQGHVKVTDFGFAKKVRLGLWLALASRTGVERVSWSRHPGRRGRSGQADSYLPPPPPLTYPLACGPLL